MLMAVMVGASDGKSAEEKELMQRLRLIEDQMAVLEDDIRRAKSELWGEGSE
jgi:hypothetical protein